MDGSNQWFWILANPMWKRIRIITFRIYLGTSPTGEPTTKHTWIQFRCVVWNHNWILNLVSQHEAFNFSLQKQKIGSPLIFCSIGNSVCLFSPRFLLLGLWGKPFASCRLSTIQLLCSKTYSGSIFLAGHGKAFWIYIHKVKHSPWKVTVPSQ